MMKQLKKCLFWKSLKQLFIISLISCFILLGSSFVNAELSIVDYWSIWNLSSVSSEWNFNYDWNNFYNATSSTSSYSRIWWESDSFLHFNKRNYNSSSYLKWKITWFFICPLMTWLWNTYLKNIDWCEYYFWFGSDFMNLIKNTDKWAYFYNSNSSNNRTVLCWVNSLSNEMICVDYSYYDNEWSWKMSDSDILAVSVQNPNKWDSWWNWNNPSTSITIWNIKQNTYNMLYNKWYRPQMCYWWFALDDLFWTWDNNSSFDDILILSGATVFELYNTYSWWLNFETWYDNNYLDYIYLKEFRDSYQYRDYFWKSRGLVWLWIVRDSFFKWTDFNTASLEYFCNMVFDNSIDKNLSAIDILDSQYWEWLIRDIVWDFWVLIPWSWTALDILYSQYFSWKDCWTVEECLANSNIFDSVQDAYNSWSVSWIKDWITWILPPFIIFGFLWIVLLYYLRR